MGKFEPTMIAGIGTDIVEVHRIARKLEQNPDFVHHVFSAEEIVYCQRQKNPPMHFAARWAAKEAYLKAAGVNFIGNHKLPCINTRNQENGKPFIELSDIELEKFIGHQYHAIHLSLSHTEQYAMASVVIETL